MIEGTLKVTEFKQVVAVTVPQGALSRDEQTGSVLRAHTLIQGLPDSQLCNVHYDLRWIHESFNISQLLSHGLS